MKTDHDGNVSNPYRPNPDWCCEACVFGRGEHSDWCAKRRPATARKAAAREDRYYRPKLKWLPH